MTVYLSLFSDEDVFFKLTLKSMHADQWVRLEIYIISSWYKADWSWFA